MNEIRRKYGISNAKLFLTWLSITAVSFILEELACLYDGIDGIVSLINDYKVLIVDVGFCALFSAISIGCSYSFLCDRLSQRRRKKVPLSVVGIVLFLLNFLVSLFIDIAYNYLFASYSLQYLLDEIYDSCLMSSLCSLIVIMHFYGHIVSIYEKEQKSIAIKLLKYQLNPHFVFNSLNILVGLIDQDPRQAESFAIKLSRIYRYITRCIGKDLVSIEEAFSHINDYCSLLQTRFPQSIDYKIKNTTNGYLIPMALQVLIENAVKHNIPDSTHKQTICLECDSEYVMLSNNIIKGASDSRLTVSEGIGLQNILTQYSLMFNKRVIIKKENGYFKVYLPIIKEEEYVQDTDYRR